MKLIRSIILSAVFLFPLPCLAHEVAVTVTYNNVPEETGLTTDWGMSCLIEGMEKVILFDTGGDSSVLLANMKKLGIDPARIEAVVLSHIHHDHIGGIWGFLEANRRVVIYCPDSFPEDFKDRAGQLAQDVVSVHKPGLICNNVWSSGELGNWMKEQSLIIDTPKGLLVVTGCAHPGIVNIVAFAKDYLRKQVYLVLGGFHLMAYDENQVKRIIEDLKRLGVEKVGPSHCTGGRAIELFREAWGEDFINFGCGARIVIGTDG